MRNCIEFTVLYCTLLIAPLSLHAQSETRARTMGRTVADFTLVNLKTEQAWQLSQDGNESELVVLYFNTTECPVTNRYLPKLNKIHKELAGKNIHVVAVNSNIHDTREEIIKHVEEYEVNFEVLRDEDGSLARRLHVTRTAEVIVLDAKRKIRYRGVVDDRFERGVTRPKVTHDYLNDAIASLLARREVKTSMTDVTACPLELLPISNETPPASAMTITYSEHVASIIQNKCQSCHRPNGIGPFELMDYENARDWSSSIREVITSGLMPPWNADAPHGHFMNDRSLTANEYETLLDWIDDGTQEGDKSHLPTPRTFSQKWGIGKPDLIVKMEKEIQVPAETPELGVPYKYVWAGQPFEKETWIQGAEIHPGATEVVHHVIAYIVPEGLEIELENDERPTDILSELNSPLTECAHLVSFVPGDNAFLLSAGMAKRIPKGARVLFEMHYTPTGKRQTDRSELGLVFAEDAPEHEVVSGDAINYWFSIPPGAPKHPVRARTEEFKNDSVLLSMNPHMHYRGRSFKYVLVEPSGTRTLLLDIPRYNFDWQSTYWLAEPIEIPKGSYIQCSATFDNSKDNPFNPDADVRVEWGEQTWQEMMLAGLEYYEK